LIAVFRAAVPISLLIVGVTQLRLSLSEQFSTDLPVGFVFGMLYLAIAGLFLRDERIITLTLGVIVPLIGLAIGGYSFFFIWNDVPTLLPALGLLVAAVVLMSTYLLVTAGARNRADRETVQ